jgi:hypothetical protein
MLVGLSDELELRLCAMAGLAPFLSGITLLAKTNLR